MVWFDKLKLKKQLVRSVNEAGYTSPKEIQLRTLSRINGGQDVVAIAPEGAGKTTAYVLGTLNRFNHAPEGVPSVLILVPDKDQVLAVLEMFNRFNKNQSIKIVGLYVTPGIEGQMDELADGADIVVATPDRARAIYLKLGLNLNKIELFIIDEGDQMIKKGMQLPLAELANSVTKCQRLLFTDVLHSRLERVIEPFMISPAIVEVDELEEQGIQTFSQLLYHVPNFGTKLNLLNLFITDDEVFTKVVVFVNSRSTAETIYNNLHRKIKEAVAFLNAPFIDLKGYKDIEAFKADESARILLVSNDNAGDLDLDDIPFLIHFDVPAEKETYISRVTNHFPDVENETLALTFTTDLELSDVKKIEQSIGQKITVADLPEELVIEKEIKTKKKEEKEPAKTDAPVTGAAFHEKKAANSKTYNYSSGTKAKMNNKRKH
ncbi:DEAD/DEAH box helicase [Mucilaginibacter gynuensis]|uniref:DEAD/DEAH box helicase n=1 Tax=Mucilaginibacter gynuensis TaxID=1302236 RepID=A0ABP8FMP3_9SPHI